MRSDCVAGLTGTARPPVGVAQIMELPVPVPSLKAMGDGAVAEGWALRTSRVLDNMTTEVVMASVDIAGFPGSLGGCRSAEANSIVGRRSAPC